jgi:hypothetical protein
VSEPTANRFTSFKDFYPFYLSEHKNPACRAMHFAGTTIMVLLIVATLMTRYLGFLWLLPIAGYGFAWLGHFLFEHNRPATFKYPFYSLLGDWVMYAQLLTRRIHFDSSRDAR